MSHGDVKVTRTRLALRPDPSRVIAKPYGPGEELVSKGPARAELLMGRILAIPEPEVVTVLAGVMASFEDRHRDFPAILERHFQLVAPLVPASTALTRERRLLIGAYFTHEYSVEAAALFNPSLVLAPDQSDLRGGEARVIMSLRAVGEGHLSSIEFRSGTLDTAGQMTLDPVGEWLVNGSRTPASVYDKHLFGVKLTELGAGNAIAWDVLSTLPDQFTCDALEQALVVVKNDAISFETQKIMRVLAASNYVTRFPADSALSERVIFPAGPNETHGMEDARFVRFVDEDGSAKYFATYTAYDGFEILPQLIETEDFVTFAISTLNGAAAQNKGMALFPRRIGGQYMMLSRKDRENLFVATSSSVRFWNDVAPLYQPQRPWELLQIGNCGSPLETDAGWLVLTHGVGPMRHYTIGAMLLDLDDPQRVIGHLPTPLLSPDETERDGYVPNVVYSCGGLIHGDSLVLPYGISDHGVNVAIVSLPSLLATMQQP